MTLDEFLDKVCKRPLPQNPMRRVRTFAEELAEGASENVWRETIDVKPEYLPTDSGNAIDYRILDTRINQYIAQRWNNDFPSIGIMAANGFLYKHSNTRFEITSNSFKLLEEFEPSTIFISYSRNESSAFALLVLRYLKQAGLEPFLDMALVPGEDFHKELRERIEAQDFLILLLGKTTLKSNWVIQEIEWALEKGLDVIPIWQPGFNFNENDWPNLSDPIKHKLANTHTIRILEENPLAYHTAMVELLSTKFGITP